MSGPSAAAPTTPALQPLSARVQVQVLLLVSTSRWALNVAMMKWLTGHFDPIRPHCDARAAHGPAALALAHAPCRMADFSPSLAFWQLAVLSAALVTGLGKLMWACAILRIGTARGALWPHFVHLFAIASAVLLPGESATRRDCRRQCWCWCCAARAWA